MPFHVYIITFIIHIANSKSKSNGDSGAGQADQEQQLHRPRPQHLHERHQAHDRKPGTWKLKLIVFF